MNRRWEMSLEEWARAVDALVVDAAPGQLYALRGRSSQAVQRAEPVAAEHFNEPHWQSMYGFVIMRSQGDDRQVAANFMPTSLEPLQPAVPIVPTNRVVYYDRNHSGMAVAAADVVDFLSNGVTPALRNDAP